MEITLHPKVTRGMLEVAATQVLTLRYESIAKSLQTTLGDDLDTKSLDAAIALVTQDQILSHLAYLVLHKGIDHFTKPPEEKDPISFTEFNVSMHVGNLVDRYHWGDL